MYEELIKKLRNRRECVQSGGDLERDYPLLKEAAAAIESMCEMVAIAYAEAGNVDADKPRWINVEDELPEEGTWVLCQCRANIKDVLRWQDGYWFHDLRHQYMGGFVTHWMPLPELPKEESP